MYSRMRIAFLVLFAVSQLIVFHDSRRDYIDALVLIFTLLFSILTFLIWKKLVKVLFAFVSIFAIFIFIKSNWGADANEFSLASICALLLLIASQMFLIASILSDGKNSGSNLSI